MKKNSFISKVFLFGITILFSSCAKEEIVLPPIDSEEIVLMPCEFLQTGNFFLLDKFKAPNHFLDGNGSTFPDDGTHGQEVLIKFNPDGTGELVILLSCNVFAEPGFEYTCNSEGVSITHFDPLGEPGDNIDFNAFVTDYVLDTTSSVVVQNNQSYSVHRLVAPGGIEITFMIPDWVCSELPLDEVCGHPVLSIDQLDVYGDFSEAGMDAVWYSNYDPQNEIVAVEALFQYVRERLVHVPTRFEEEGYYIDNQAHNMSDWIAASADCTGGGVCGYYANVFDQILWERYGITSINTSLQSISPNTNAGGHMVSTIRCTENGVSKFIRLDPMLGESYKWTHNNTYVDALVDLPRLVANGAWQDSVLVVQDQSLTLSWDEGACAQADRSSYNYPAQGVYENADGKFIIQSQRTMPNYLSNGFLGEYQILTQEWGNVFPGMPTIQNEFEYIIVNALCIQGMWGNGIDVDSVYTEYNQRRNALIQ